MKTLLVLLLVSGLVAESSAFPDWSSFKEMVKDRYGDVESFFTDLGKKAKDFVTGRKGEFEKLSNDLEGKLEQLKKCKDCEGGACNEDENVKCEELFIIYEKVRDFMNCVDDPTRNDCDLKLGRSATSPPKRELSQRRIGLPATNEEEEGDDAEQEKQERRVAGLPATNVEEEGDDAEQEKQERRVAVLLKALLKKTQK